MTDQPMNVEGLEQAPPRLSDEGLAAYRAQLSDPTFQRDYPRQYEALRQSVENALAFTGQQLDPNPDRRTVAQQEYDRHFALTPSPQLVEVAQRDANGAEQQDPEAVSKMLARIGKSYQETLQNARHAIEYCKELAGIDPKKLTGATLVHVSNFGAHLKKYQGKRPV